MLECARIRDSPESGQKRLPLNRGHKGQSSSKKHLLTAEVSRKERELNTQYIVRARPIAEEMAQFWDLLNEGTIGAQEPDGAEIVASMRRAVVKGDKVEWSETCYCSPPLRHERSTVYDRFFADMEIEPLARPTRLEGKRFWDQLRVRGIEEGRRPEEGITSVARYVPIRIF